MQLAHFRASLLGVALVRASAYLVSPARSWLKALHDSVRDDRYLVGMRLQDHSDNKVSREGAEREGGGRRRGGEGEKIEGGEQSERGEVGGVRERERGRHSQKLEWGL